MFLTDTEYFKQYKEKLGFSNQSNVKIFFAAKDIIPTVDYKYIDLLNDRLFEIIEKINAVVVDELRIENFSEAFNVIGLAIDAKPLSIRNYRDEFDPVFPNERKGWRKRPMFKTRKEMLNKYGNIELEDFTKLIKQIIYKNPDIDLIEDKVLEDDDRQNTFAKRLITGQAAEQYFKDNFKKIDLFKGLDLEDTTKLGCGFDFKLNFEDNFYAVEVKGLEKHSGSLMLTNKEHKIATILRENYFIFLVKNFIEIPNHKIFRNPVFENELAFIKKERILKQVSWNTKV